MKIGDRVYCRHTGIHEGYSVATIAGETPKYFVLSNKAHIAKATGYERGRGSTQWQVVTAEAAAIITAFRMKLKNDRMLENMRGREFTDVDKAHKLLTELETLLQEKKG